MKLLDVMAKDPEIKYWLVILGGGLVGGMGAIFDTLSGGTAPQQSASTTSDGIHLPPWAWLVSPPIAAAWLVVTNGQSVSTATKLQEASGVGKLMEVAGLSVSGAALAILMLKAIFGEKGLEQFIKDMPGIGSLGTLIGAL
jgi:hypothetical protein